MNMNYWKDPNYWKSLPPSDTYGNIYYPFHIMDWGNMWYRVADEHSVPVSGALRWTSATTVTKWMNNGENPPALAIILEAAKKVNDARF